MKRIWLIAPAVLLPYFVLLFTALILFSSSVSIFGVIIEKLFDDNALYVIAALVVLVLFSAVLSIICFVLSICKRWDPLSMAKTAMVVKLIQIPAYVLIYVFGALLTITVFTIPFTYAFFLLDCVTVFLSGLLTVSAVINALRRRAVSKKAAVIIIATQIFFVADVFGAVALFVLLSRRTGTVNMKYRNYIFDFGNTIVKFDPETMSKPYISDETDRKTVREVVFDRLYWDRLDTGEIDDDYVISAVKERLPYRLHTAAVDTYLNWYYHLPYIDGMYELIRRIKDGGGKLYLLSNISNGFAENYKNAEQLADLFSMFDGVVFSAPIKTVKPDKEIFGYLLKKYGLGARESIFIDDNKKNVDAAISLGINGYLFDGDSKALEKMIFLV